MTQSWNQLDLSKLKSPDFFSLTCNIYSPIALISPFCEKESDKIGIYKQIHSNPVSTSSPNIMDQILLKKLMDSYNWCFTSRRLNVTAVETKFYVNTSLWICMVGMSLSTIICSLLWFVVQIKFKKFKDGMKMNLRLGNVTNNESQLISNVAKIAPIISPSQPLKTCLFILERCFHSNVHTWSMSNPAIFSSRIIIIIIIIRITCHHYFKQKQTQHNRIIKLISGEFWILIHKILVGKIFM